MKFKHVFLFILLAVFSILSCKKDSGISPDLPESDEIQKALQSLRTQEEKDFFNKNYVTAHHPFISPALKNRGGEEDSLVNEVFEHLLLLNQSSPFLTGLIDNFGYPIWDQSEITADLDNDNYKVVITPFAKFTDGFISGYTVALPDPTDFTTWHVMTFHSHEMDSLVQLQESCNIANLQWLVKKRLDFDEYLFNHTNQWLKDWLDGCQQDGEGFKEGLSSRDCGVIVLGDCMPYVFAPTGGAIEDRTPCPLGQVFVSINFYVNCAGGGGGSSTSNGIGSGLYGSTGGPGLPGGSSNTNAPSPAVQQIISLCQQYAASQEPGGTPNGIPGGYNQETACKCEQFQNIQQNVPLSSPHLECLYAQANCEGNNTAGALSNYVASSGTSDDKGQLISSFLNSTNCGGEGMGFKQFELLYNKVKSLEEELGLTQQEKNFLLAHERIANSLYNFEQNHPNNPDAIEHANDQLDYLMADEDYLQFVESSFTWPSVFWQIAKEMIADKVIDIIFKFLPGFGQAENVKDAIKALNNGDWIDFTYNVGQVIVGNTPLGKLLKAWEAVDEVQDLLTLVDRVWDKIGNLSNAAIERLWNIAKKSPLRFNENYLKYIDDIKFPKFGAYFATINTYSQNFKNHWSEIKDDIGQVHHAVPRDVLTRYPNLGITQDQMHSLENLRGIPNDGSLDHQTITNWWVSFYNTNPNATLQELFDYAKFIDDEFGHLFVPPVR